MDAWPESEPVGVSTTPDNMPEWKDLDSMLGSPKPWSMVDMPDLFLTNLIHDVDHTFTDDSLTDFSSTVATSGSETESSPGAFQEFMMRHSSPESLSHSPPPLVPGITSPTQFTIPLPDTERLDLAPHVAQTNEPLTASFGLDQVPVTSYSPAYMEMTLGISPASVQHGVEPVRPVASTETVPPVASMSSMALTSSKASDHSNTPVPPAMSAAATKPDIQASKAVSTPSATSEETILAPLRMQPGSNHNAMMALSRLRSAVHESEKQIQAKKAPCAKMPSVSAPSHEMSIASATTTYSESDAQHPGQHARKNAHNAIERRYRSNINDRIAGLRDVVPALRETRPRNGRRKRRRGKTEDIELVDGVRAATKLSKATILTKATEYICYLKSREVQLSREVAGLHMLLRSFEGGDELLTQWSAEMERLHNQYPPIEAVYSGVETPLLTSPNASATDVTATSLSSSSSSAFPRGSLDVEEEDDESADESDEADDTESLSSGSGGDPVRATKVARYMFGAFVGLSLFGRWDWGDLRNTDADLALLNTTALSAPISTSSLPQAHVMGVGHQLWKRSLSMDDKPRPYDDVPTSDLLWEVARGCVLVTLIVAVVCSMGTQARRWALKRGYLTASRLQDASTLSDLLCTPLEQVRSPPMPLAQAKVTYERLGDRLCVPSTRLGLLMHMTWTCSCWLSAATVPGVAGWIRSLTDPTVALIKKRAFIRRAEFELALGRSLQPDWFVRLHTLVTLHFYASVFGAELDEKLVLALVYLDVAERTHLPYMAQRGAQVWHSTAARLVDASSSSDPGQEQNRRMLSELFSVPICHVSAYARTASCGNESSENTRRDEDSECGHVSVSPLANMIDALRHEALLSFWTTMISSMMRASDSVESAPSAHSCWHPAVLDIVRDTASLASVQQQLASLTRDRASSSSMTVEQILVAHGMLNLAAGRLARAHLYVRMLGSKPISLCARQFIALWADAPFVTSRTPVGPVDMLASVAIGWFAMQRMYATHNDANATENAKVWHDRRRKSASSLHALASQCLWTFVSPDKKGSSNGTYVRDLLPPNQVPCLAQALDSLMDNLLLT